MNQHRALYLLGLTAWILTGCVTARVEEFLPVRPVLQGDDAVVILTNRQDAIVEAEESFSECLYKQIDRGRALNVISEGQFKDALFPWFEPRLAPTKAETVAQMMQEPLISRKVSDLNIRYLVWIHGESEMLNKQGVMTCTLSPAGGGCLGVLSWDNNSTYEASIWDIREGESMGIISTEATGTSVIPALGVPIPMIARTKTASCKSLADQLRSALTGP
ncbi:MAG: hypothetical protein QNJ40_21915 [Xanthomonadales bacterium]|nr:hypothetical protein [Xanthomonadales bacterium]